MGVVYADVGDSFGKGLIFCDFLVSYNVAVWGYVGGDCGDEHTAVDIGVHRR